MQIRRGFATVIEEPTGKTPLFNPEWEGDGEVMIRESGDLPGNGKPYSATNRDRFRIAAIN